jgi:hypothetical protein
MWQRLENDRVRGGSPTVRKGVFKGDFGMAEQSKLPPEVIGCIVLGILIDIVAFVLVASERINVRSAIFLMFFGTMVGFIPTMISKMKLPK